ncbi:MAG TPA: RNA-binding protein [Roseiarcus sp.]|nr:RNA-binding protein [Roseiarcus sp.]
MWIDNHSAAWLQKLEAAYNVKRPRDTNQLGKLMVDILTGQVEDREPTPEERGVDPAASAMGKKGGPARAASMTPERRAEIAKRAAEKRWSK